MDKLEQIAYEKKEMFWTLLRRFQKLGKTFESFTRASAQLQKDMRDNGADIEAVFLYNALLDCELRLSVVEEQLCCRIERLSDPEGKPHTCRMCQRVTFV